MDFTRMRPLAAATILAALTEGALIPNAAAQRSGTPTSRELLQLNTDLNDPDKAFEAVKTARSYLASKPDSAFRVFLHRGIVTGLIVGKAPGHMVVGAADSAIKTFRREPLQQVVIYGQVAQYLVNHRDLPKRALQMARSAVLGIPNEERYLPFRGFVLGTLGDAYLLNNKPDSALLVLKTALAMAPDSQRVLRQLGDAYAHLKKDDLAINAYSRSLTVYLGADTSAAPPLKALWTRKHGSLKGFDASLAKFGAASRKTVALDARRHDRSAPGWTLPNLDGKSLSLADHKGKVVVLDFWGTWCGPCREELPIFQKVYERYRNRDVVFYGVNWERTGPGQDATKLVRDYMAKFNYTFPVVLDRERSAQVAYSIEAFPTVFLIDKAGNIRYRNVGLSPGIEQILTDQIESLLN
ncbi:MAG: redoxin domain-containing protein [Candidatus Eisenbacteria bacterium]